VFFTEQFMDLNKFTEKSQAALMEAQAIGTRNQHQAVDVEHLALALLEQEEGLVPRLLEKAGVSPDSIEDKDSGGSGSDPARLRRDNDRPGSLCHPASQ
jgi:ATP-dependent Clp protease ATP-binding subunit ClpB